MALRRDFQLSDEDRTFLDLMGLPWEAVVEGGVNWVLIHDFPTSNSGYSTDKVTAAIRLEPGYPLAQLDMVFVEPKLLRKDGREIPATNGTVTLLSRTFQQWSRHRSEKNPWQPGEDNLESHVMLIHDWFKREFERCPAQ